MGTSPQQRVTHCHDSPFPPNGAIGLIAQPASPNTAFCPSSATRTYSVVADLWVEGSFGARSHDLAAFATTGVFICHPVNTVFACPSWRFKLSSLHGRREDPVSLLYISLEAVPSALLFPQLLTLLTDPAPIGRDSTSVSPSSMRGTRWSRGPRPGEPCPPSSIVMLCQG